MLFCGEGRRSPDDLVHRLANTSAFDRRCRGPVPGRVSSRDKGDPRRGGQASDEHARRSPGIACRSRKGIPGDRRLRLGLHRQSFVGLPAPGSAYRKYACAVLGRPSRSDGASTSPRLPTLTGTGPSLPLRCAPCAVLRSSTPQSRAAARRGTSTLSVRQAIYETVHLGEAGWIPPGNGVEGESGLHEGPGGRQGDGGKGFG